MMEMTEKKFQTPELTLNYAEGPANGPPLVLLHGQGSVWQDWEPVIGHFQADWHILAPDFRGCGGSGRSSSGNYEIEHFTDDIRHLIGARVDGPVVIVGHSLGSMVALNYAAQAPQGHVRGIVLEDPPLYLHEFFTEWMWYSYYPISKQVLEEGLSESQIAEVFAEKLDLAEADAIKEARSLVRIDPKIIYQVMEGDLTEEFDVEAHLKKIACPSLLLYGEWELGSAIRPEDIDRVSAIQPPGSMIRIEGAGHGLHLADCRPVEFNRATGEFLKHL